MYNASINKEKATVAILVSDKINYKIRSISRDRDISY